MNKQKYTITKQSLKKKQTEFFLCPTLMTRQKKKHLSFSYPAQNLPSFSFYIHFRQFQLNEFGHCKLESDSATRQTIKLHHKCIHPYLRPQPFFQSITHMNLLLNVNLRLGYCWVSWCCSCNSTGWLNDNHTSLWSCKCRPPRLNVCHMLIGYHLTTRSKNKLFKS